MNIYFQKGYFIGRCINKAIKLEVLKDEIMQINLK